MTATVQREPFAFWCKEAEPLFRAHWEEVGVFKDAMPLDVDVETILRLEQAGQWLSWTIRREGALYGYCCVLLSPHLHYRPHRVAMVDVIYVAPGARGGLLGLHLLRTVMSECKGLATKIIVHAKIQHDFAPLLNRLGFVATETNYEALL